jgi:hypothetical protein
MEGNVFFMNINMNKSFVEAFKAGEVKASQVHDYVDYWHTHETGSKLHEFLGMTEGQYYDWVMQSDAALKNILENEDEYKLDTTIQVDEDGVPICKVCGCKMGVKTSVGIIASSCFIGTDTCFECQVDYCLNTNCLGCKVGTYPDCPHLETKKSYQEAASLESEEAAAQKED